MTASSHSQSPALLRAIPERPARVFAVGDIHGCADELEAMLNFLKQEQSLGSEDLLVFLGDYIDRGPKSREVIEQALAIRKELPNTVFLKGNHEDMLLDYLGFGGESGDVYLENGGAEFLKSYGLHPFSTRADILAALPTEHIEFFRRLELGVLLAEFLFVHAGLHPGRSLDEQSSHDLMWIRGQFTHATHSVGKTVVFGHTPFEDVMLHLPYKIGVDTGLVFGNRLSVVELVHGQLFQLDHGENTVKTFSLRERLGG
jgi:serine/threonine protein phosphatase 1